MHNYTFLLSYFMAYTRYYTFQIIHCFSDSQKFSQSLWHPSNMCTDPTTFSSIINIQSQTMNSMRIKHQMNQSDIASNVRYDAIDSVHLMFDAHAVHCLRLYIDDGAECCSASTHLQGCNSDCENF